MTNKLSIIRRSKGLSQDTLAKISGVSRPYISDIERGAQPSITNVVMLKIAMALGEKVEDIFFIDDVVYSQQADAENTA